MGFFLRCTELIFDLGGFKNLKFSGEIQVKIPEPEKLPELFRCIFQVIFRQVQVKVQPVTPEIFR